MEASLPPGFRFHPTDEELITYYLGNKVSDMEFTTRAVADVDLNKCEPWDLPGKASMGEKEWYFFSLRDRKYPTGLRTNRATEAGYWKTTGKDKEITRGGVLVGMKKTLVFYRGRAPKGEKTNWVMHEYRLENKVIAFKPNKGEWVVCRVFEKSSTVLKKCHQQTASPPISRDEQLTGDDNNLLSLTNTNDIDSENNMNIAQQLQHYNSMINWPNAAAAANYSMPICSTNNLSMNSLLLTALQLRSHDDHHHRPMNYSFMHSMPPLQLLQGENDYFDNMGSTSSRPVTVLGSLPEPPSDQPFDLDSNIW